jgi:isopentenyl-diphosphate Delta-isomerase
MTHTATNEYVVLVNEQNEPIGKALKSQVHTGDTPLHRGFSVFIFNSRGDLLLQQRSRYKKTWPLVWSNSCCGHPQPGEETIDAAQRRLLEELGLEIPQLWEVLPDYRYRAEMKGVVENEICPVFVGFTEEQPIPNQEEIHAVRWTPWEEFIQTVATANPPYSSWCVEETQLLAQNQTLQQLLQEHTK